MNSGPHGEPVNADCGFFSHSLAFVFGICGMLYNNVMVVANRFSIFMNAAFSQPLTPPCHPALSRCRQSDSVAVLAMLYDTAVNVAIVERPVPGEFADYPAVLAASAPTLRLATLATPAIIARYLQQHLPAHDQQRAFINDIVWVADMLACLFGADEVGMRLQVLAHAPCPRFHTDKVAIRALVTYLGAATQWLEEGVINDTQAGDIVLFKGEGWEGNEGFGWVHRSSAINEGQRRIVLTLDPRLPGSA